MVVNIKLTKTEQEVLDMLTEEYLTPKQITIRRKTSQEATNKIIRKLKKKGAYNIGCQKVVDLRVAQQPPQPKNQIRLHNQQFSIRILWKDRKYKEKLENTSEIEIDGNTINLWPNSIDIYSNQSFYGDDLTHAFAKSATYWNHFIARLEHEVSCILKKPRSQNIRLCRLHIAETNNEVAKDIDNRGDRYFKIYAREDGKLWFLIDNSFNLHETEFVHSKTAKEDAQKILSGVFNDYRDKEHYLPSDAKGMIDKLTMISSNILQCSLKTNDNIAWLSENIKTHGPAWFGMAKEAGNIRKEVKRLSGILSQKKLKEYL